MDDNKKNINHITHITWRFFDHGTFDGWFQIHGEFHQFHQLTPQFTSSYCFSKTSLDACNPHLCSFAVFIYIYIHMYSNLEVDRHRFRYCWNMTKMDMLLKIPYSIYFRDLQGDDTYIYIHTYTMFDFVVFGWFTQYDQMCGYLIIHMFGCCSMICFVFPVLSYVMTHIWGSKFHWSFVG